jgi:hypothetical protein
VKSLDLFHSTCGEKEVWANHLVVGEACYWLFGDDFHFVKKKSQQGGKEKGWRWERCSGFVEA